MRLRRGPRPTLAVGAGERLLAWAVSPEGDVGGTAAALYLPGRRVPWEQVQSADWDSEDGVLRVVEVGSWGEVRPVHRLSLEAPDRLLQLVRERVTASILLERQVPVAGRRGLRVVARRAPGGSSAPIWLYELDEGLDPDDPVVREAAERTLAQARAELGDG